MRSLSRITFDHLTVSTVPVKVKFTSFAHRLRSGSKVNERARRFYFLKRVKKQTKHVAQKVLSNESCKFCFNVSLVIGSVCTPASPFILLTPLRMDVTHQFLSSVFKCG